MIDEGIIELPADQNGSSRLLFLGVSDSRSWRCSFVLRSPGSTSRLLPPEKDDGGRAPISKLELARSVRLIA